jgi:glutathione S-transferase
MTTPDRVAMPPLGLVPVLVDGDFVLWESNAVITYRASVHRIPPPPPLLLRPMLRGIPDVAGAEASRRDFSRCTGVLEGALARSEYVSGPLSVADFALASVLTNAAMVGLCLDPFRATTSWFHRMLAGHSFQRCLAETRVSTSLMYPADDGNIS